MTAVFIETSSDTYERHTYIITRESAEPIAFEYYQDAQNYWFANVKREKLIAIEVIDRPTKKTKTKPKGF